MDVKLVVVGGDAKAAEIKLRLPTVVGRGRDVSLTLPHPLVSRRHCEIYAKDGRLHVRDLGSLNGTFVNNERIEGEAALPPGELLTIGTVTFRAVYEEVTGERATTDDEAEAPSADQQPEETGNAPAAVAIGAEANGLSGSDTDSVEDLEDVAFEELEQPEELDQLEELGQPEELDQPEEIEQPQEIEQPEELQQIDEIEEIEEIPDTASSEQAPAELAQATKDDTVHEESLPAELTPPTATPHAEDGDEDDDDDALNAFLKGLD